MSARLSAVGVSAPDDLPAFFHHIHTVLPMDTSGRSLSGVKGSEPAGQDVAQDAASMFPARLKDKLFAAVASELALRAIKSEAGGDSEDVSPPAEQALCARDAVLTASIVAIVLACLESEAGRGAALILAERARQVAEEGFTPERDSSLYTTELARASQSYVAAALYAQATGHRLGLPPDSWPFEEAAFKPSEDPKRNLEKAGALIAAELDRAAASLQ